MIKVQTYLEENVKRKLDNLASANGLDVSSFIRHVLTCTIAGVKPNLIKPEEVKDDAAEKRER